MLDETLNIYPHIKVHIDIDPNAKPVHFMPQPVPQIHLKTFKREDNRVRWIGNSHQLNRVIRCKQYPLPTIIDILRKCSGYIFFTKLDNSMQYYTFELDNKSQDSCTIITPFGKYKFLRLPMGLKCSPDIAQAIMEMYCQKIDEEVIR
jgi:hypothetical protein